MIKLGFKKINSKAILPSQKHSNDAGWDIYSIENTVVMPGKTKIIPTGIALEMKWNMETPSMKTYFETLSPLIKQEVVDFHNHFSFFFQEYIKSFFKFLFQVESRSGLAANHGIHVIGGIVDEDYRGEIKIILANTNKQSYHINVGDRIAQGIPKIIPRVEEIFWVEKLEETKRGNKGIGSTGK